MARTFVLPCYWGSSLTNTNKRQLVSPDNSPAKIEDLSFLNPEDIKLQNTHFLEQNGMEYRVGQGLLDHRLRHDIWVVRNGDIKKLLERFPYDESLHDQCAL